MIGSGDGERGVAAVGEQSTKYMTRETQVGTGIGSLMV